MPTTTHWTREELRRSTAPFPRASVSVMDPAAPSLSRWGRCSTALCLGSGRQALGLVARWCRAHGITTVLLPAYHCETMALPFWLEAMRVRTVAVDANLQTDPEALARALAESPEPTLVLVCPVGAIAPSTGLTEVIRRARTAGHVVVEDATHALLEELASPAPAIVADIRLASLRKLLPLPEGAWLVTGPRVELGALRPRRAVDEQLTRAGLALLDQQRRWASRAGLPAAGGHGAPESASPLVAATQAADEALDAALEPALASRRTRSDLAELDLRHWATSWRRVNTELCALLPHDAHVLNPGRACFPIMRHRRAPQLDEALGTRGAFAPQYWPRPGWLAKDVAWPEDLVSVDVRPGQAPGRAAGIAEIIAATLADV